MPTLAAVKVRGGIGNARGGAMARTMVITGASRGIGAATALLAAERGWNVCVNYLSRQAEADTVVAKARAAGVRAIAVQGDAGAEADVDRLFATAEGELGPITDVVVNAGTTGKKSRMDEYSGEALRRLVDVNLMGPLYCCRNAVRRMSTRLGGKGGNIVLISSVATTQGGAGVFVPYAATKGAINTLVMGLAREVGAEGIRVNGVLPGIIDTDMHALTGITEVLPMLAAEVPLRRLGAPQEIARAILWLLSDEASYAAGSMISVTGGR
jgi:NAD(P)-dependent dehydrogenase (short-subunit alcohol dehydrogenase family)